MKHLPAVVVFDLGRVLVDFDYHIAAKRISSRGSVGMSETLKLLCQSPLLDRLERGGWTTKQYFEEIQKLTGFSGTFEEFGGFFSDIFCEIKPMIQWQDALKKQGMPTYILSNTNDFAISHIRKTFPFFSNFTDYVLSYEAGVMKPEPRIYEIVEERCRKKGAEILYLDDNHDNVKAAAARDWTAVLHETPAKTAEILAKIYGVGAASSFLRPLP